MTTEQVRERLALLTTREWPRVALESWLGIRFAEALPLLAQFHMWQTGTYEAAYQNPPTIDRNRFAMFLQARRYLPLRGAAVSLALTDESFNEIMTAERTRQIFGSEAEGSFVNVYNSEFITEFFKVFPGMRRRVFSDTNTFFKKLHAEIHEQLKVKPVARMCVTSKALGENPQQFGAALDAITEEPMCLPYQVVLETKRPAQLRPDSCSWFTYFQFETILKPFLLGAPPDCSEQQEAALKDYAARN